MPKNTNNNHVRQALVYMRVAEELVKLMWFDVDNQFYKQFVTRKTIIDRAMTSLVQILIHKSDSTSVFAIKIVRSARSILDRFRMAAWNSTHFCLENIEVNDWIQATIEDEIDLRDLRTKLDAIKLKDLCEFLPRSVAEIVSLRDVTDEPVDLNELSSLYDKLELPTAANSIPYTNICLPLGIDSVELGCLFPSCMVTERDILAYNKDYRPSHDEQTILKLDDDDELINEKPLVILDRVQKACAKRSIDSDAWAYMARERLIKYPFACRFTQLLDEGEPLTNHWAIFCRIILTVLEAPRTLEDAQKLIISSSPRSYETAELYHKRVSRYQLYEEWRNEFAKSASDGIMQK